MGKKDKSISYKVFVQFRHKKSDMVCILPFILDLPNFYLSLFCGYNVNEWTSKSKYGGPITVFKSYIAAKNYREHLLSRFTKIGEYDYVMYLCHSKLSNINMVWLVDPITGRFMANDVKDLYKGSVLADSVRPIRRVL